MLSQSDLSRLNGAFWGVAIGAALALTLACIIFPPAGTYVDRGFGILWTEKWTSQEDREKGFYALTLLLGIGLGGLGASWRTGGNRVTIASALMLAVCVPAMSAIIGLAIVSGRLAAACYGVAAALAIFAASRAINFFATRRDFEVTGAPIFAHTALSAQIGADRSIWRTGLILASAVALVAVLLLPVSARGIATAIAANPAMIMHMASFMIGPATYFFDHGLIPGIDYFTQYSVGTPWLFSNFLAPTVAGTVLNAVRFVIAENVFFNVTLFVFLWWFLRGWGWALALTVAILMTQFGTEQPFHAPSSTAARYPLLMVVACLYAVWIKRNFSFPIMVALALALAAALFTNTETGIYAAAAIAIATVLAIPGFARSAGKIALLGVLTFFMFMAISLIAFGPGVLDPRYLWYLVEPMMLYSTGLGAWPIKWGAGFYWLYNIITPGFALASVAWVAVVSRQPSAPFPAAHLAALAMISLIGLFMTAKYINMSIVGLWQVNSLGFFIVLAWWARGIIDRLGDQRIGSSLRLRHAATTALAIATAAFLCLISDERNPSLYAVAAYRTHPSLVNLLLRQPVTPDCKMPIGQCISRSAAPEDVALITRHTTASDRVAVLNLYDWVYLIEAQRASKFLFIPSITVFTERQFRESLRDLNLIFLPRQPENTLGIVHPSKTPELVALLKEKFEMVDQGRDLLAWRRVR